VHFKNYSIDNKENLYIKISYHFSNYFEKLIFCHNAYLFSLQQKGFKKYCTEWNYVYESVCKRSKWHHNVFWPLRCTIWSARSLKISTLIKSSSVRISFHSPKTKRWHGPTLKTFLLQQCGGRRYERLFSQNANFVHAPHTETSNTNKCHAPNSLIMNVISPPNPNTPTHSKLDPMMHHLTHQCDCFFVITHFYQVPYEIYRDAFIYSYVLYNIAL